MLWDRGETKPYAHHMTDDPYTGTPAHRVPLHEAFGDHQVANVATEVMARTTGASLVSPALVPGRHPDVEPSSGIPVVPEHQPARTQKSGFLRPDGVVIDVCGGVLCTT